MRQLTGSGGRDQKPKALSAARCTGAYLVTVASAGERTSDDAAGEVAVAERERKTTDAVSARV
ncbi:MAG: hypothetical protein EOP05_19770 [Proteobacteria bacterium]|nr:MAG: hypothetical protein EOP05_19770 [Pseudomonadota bacterium]